MKVKILTIALAILAGTFASCSKQDDDINNISESSTGISERVEAGKIDGFYSIAKFYIRDLNHTEEFKDVRLLFADENVLYVLHDGGRRDKGVWGVDYQNRQMKMAVDSNDRLEMLNGGYNIMSIDEEFVYLKSVTGDSKTLVLKKTKRVRRR
jgi:hypothetical protein